MRIYDTFISNRRIAIPFYLTVVLFYWISLYLYVPTLPIYAATKTSNLTMVGVILSMYGLWQLVIRIPLGIAVDSSESKKLFIFLGFILLAVGASVMGRASGSQGLLFGRAITGIAAGTWVPLIVVFSTFFKPDEAIRATALLTTVGTFGRIVATSSTGALNLSLGYPGAFFLAAGAAVVALLIMAFIPVRAQVRRRPSIQSLRALFIRKDVLVPALLNALLQFGDWTTTFGFTPILARAKGANDTTISLLISLSIFIVLIGNLGTTFLVKKAGAKRIVAVSFLFMIIGISGLAFSDSLPSIFLSQFFIGLSMGLGYPTLMGMSIREVQAGERNSAMGLHQAVYSVGMFAGPWLSGILADTFGLSLMFGLVATAIAAVGLTVIWRTL